MRAALAGLQIRVLDLPDEHLARIVPGYLLVDVDAAGHGWFIDATPGADEEFATTVGATEFSAAAGTAFARADLLTVLTHEIGHLLDHDDLHVEDHPHDLMAEALPLSTRRLPAAHQGEHELADRVVLDPAQTALQRMISAYSLVVLLGQESSFWQAAGIDGATFASLDIDSAGLFAGYFRGVLAAAGHELPDLPQGAPPAEPFDLSAIDLAHLDAEAARVWSAVDELLLDLNGFAAGAGALDIAALDAVFAEWGADES